MLKYFYAKIGILIIMKIVFKRCWYGTLLGTVQFGMDYGISGQRQPTV